MPPRRGTPHPMRDAVVSKNTAFCEKIQQRWPRVASLPGFFWLENQARRANNDEADLRSGHATGGSTSTVGTRQDSKRRQNFVAHLDPPLIFLAGRFTPQASRGAAFSVCRPSSGEPGALSMRPGASKRRVRNRGGNSETIKHLNARRDATRHHATHAHAHTYTHTHAHTHAPT